MEYAIQQLFDGRNTQYDQEIVEIFYSLLKKKIIQP
jgi:HD-GYP domain-containing protein (c-di-GMP phosphodiesterase class II)